MTGRVVDPRTPVDAADRMGAELAAIKRRLELLEAPTGTSVYQTVAKLTQLVSNIQAQLDAYNAARYTNAQIDARILNPGLVGAVNSSAMATFTSVVAPSGISSAGAYNFLVTGGGSYRSLWVKETGEFGYAPSSRRFKQDIVDWNLDPTLLAQLRPVLFRYIADVNNNGSKAMLNAGLIAEEVHALGLTQLVDYDPQGQPFGVRYDLLSVALIKLVQLRATERSWQLKTATLNGMLLGATQTVPIVWDTPFVDARYSLEFSVYGADGLLAAVSQVAPVPGTRTKNGVSIQIKSSGVLSAGGTLTVVGSHA